MSVQYKTSDGWKNISSSSNNAVDAVENGNLNPVTSNAVYDALPTFELYVIPLTYTVAANGYVDLQTDIPWSEDIIVIPRWYGTTNVVFSNYFNSNNKVKITLRNITSNSVSITNLDCYFAVIRSKVNWS